MAYFEQVPARKEAAWSMSFQAMAPDELQWPEATMQAFILRMADHGHCVSRTFMIFDRHYALEQMQHAHSLADDELRELAMALFRHSESRLAAMPHMRPQQRAARASHA